MLKCASLRTSSLSWIATRSNVAGTSSRRSAALLILVLAGLSCHGNDCVAQDGSVTADKAKVEKKEKTDAKTGAADWTPLFNGKDLAGWESTNFGGEGNVYQEKDYIVITQGADLSGITSTQKDLPRSNYEIEFEAQRALGSDFFAGLTFPVRESSASLIMGGWGGGVCGISSLDGMDASENETTSYVAFENRKWYKIRLRVTDDKIEAWLDKDRMVDVEIKDRKIDVRFEVELSKPLGFSTYQTTAHIRNARMRKLPDLPAKTSSDATK